LISVPCSVFKSDFTKYLNTFQPTPLPEASSWQPATKKEKSLSVSIYLTNND